MKDLYRYASYRAKEKGNLTIEGDVPGMAVGTLAELLEFFKNFHPADGN